MQAETDLLHGQQALEDEKAQMQSIPAADNDLVHLNVGGHLMTTKRSTLTQVLSMQSIATSLHAASAEMPLHSSGSHPRTFCSNQLLRLDINQVAGTYMARITMVMLDVRLGLNMPSRLTELYWQDVIAFGQATTSDSNPEWILAFANQIMCKLAMPL